MPICSPDVIINPTTTSSPQWADYFMREHVYGTLHWLAAAQMDLSNYQRLTQGWNTSRTSGDGRPTLPTAQTW